MIGTYAEHIAIRSAINKLRFFSLSTLRSDLAMYQIARDRAQTVLGYNYFTERIEAYEAQIADLKLRMEGVK